MKGSLASILVEYTATIIIPTTTGKSIFIKAAINFSVSILTFERMLNVSPLRWSSKS